MVSEGYQLNYCWILKLLSGPRIFKLLKLCGNQLISTPCSGLCSSCFGGKYSNSWIWNDIGRNCLLGHRKKIDKFLMRTSTCHTTFLYNLHVCPQPSKWCVFRFPWDSPVTFFTASLTFMRPSQGRRWSFATCNCNMQIKLINWKSDNRGLENWTRPPGGIKPEINKQKTNIEFVITLQKIIKVSVSREFLSGGFLLLNSFPSARNEYVFVISNFGKKSQKSFNITRDKCSLPVTTTQSQLIEGISSFGFKCLWFPKRKPYPRVWI